MTVSCSAQCEQSKERGVLARERYFISQHLQYISDKVKRTYKYHTALSCTMLCSPPKKIHLGPDLLNTLRQSYDYLTIMHNPLTTDV